MIQYKVVVKYVGDNHGCEEYEDAIDEITLSPFTQEFTPEGFYCDDQATVKVTPSSSTAVYSWWKTAAANTLMGQSVGEEEKKETLIEEVKRLRMENEYLKKLNALIQKREKSEKSTK